jgi:pheromone shutdown-related protein TraB
LIELKPNIAIIGTAHVSEKSASEVKEVIERERPKVVAVELCHRRLKALRDEAQSEVKINDILKGNAYYFLASWLLAYVQNKIGSNVGVKPGAEFLAAIEAANKIEAELALVDRDIQITLQRFWTKMTFFEKIKMIWALLSAIFEMRNEEIDLDTITQKDAVDQMMQELREFSPSAGEVLVDERDAFIAGNLINLAKKGKVVAVVGAGHIEGIKRYLDNPELIPKLENLVAVPKQRFNLLNILTWLFISIIAFLCALLMMAGVSLQHLLLSITILFLCQGIFSSLAVILAGGHIYSALIAFSLAWFAFLNPFIAVGWLAGYVEAVKRPPRKEDFNFRKIESLVQLYENRLFRIILIAAVANAGSMLGTLIGTWLMFSYTGVSLEALKNSFWIALSKFFH